MNSDWQRGKLVRWNNDRGFGFIQPEDQSREIFLHISDVDRAKRSPCVGDIILYQTTPGKQGKPRACHAKIQGATAPKVTLQFNPVSVSLVVKVVLLALLPLIGSIHLTLTQRNPIPLLLYPAMSGITFIVYHEDKFRAKERRWRIPEQQLHFFELCGGWLGAYVAQQLIRHKSNKPSYQREFFAIVAIHLVGWTVWFISQAR
ncbi:cold shock and DUF1294 domain-containing protein [Pseudanabaenaceae cyanobacterium LEGE 13415]|nr:cold shock and DUF1294 domain-containing protein [Pseudanabaenaceae cyanobacterium LEGE 13415]